MVDFRPSLGHLTGAKTALALVYNPDVIGLALDPRLDSNPGLIEDVFGLLNCKAAALALTTECRKVVKNTSKNMILELMRWRRSHSVISSKISTTYICWDAFGSIDRLKTARKWLDGPYLDILCRFHLACCYCFFNDALTLWENMTEKERLKANDKTLLALWIHQCPVGSRNLESFISWAESVIDEVVACNFYTFCFILERKTPAEQQLLLRSTVLRVDIHDDFRMYCFQRLDKDAQDEVLEKIPVPVIKCCLTCPFQSFIVPLAARIWTKLSPKIFCDILSCVLCKLALLLFQSSELVEILQELWRRSSASFKIYVNETPFIEMLKILLTSDCLEDIDIYELHKLVMHFQHAYGSKI